MNASASAPSKSSVDSILFDILQPIIEVKERFTYMIFQYVTLKIPLKTCYSLFISKCYSDPWRVNYVPQTTRIQYPVYVKDIPVRPGNKVSYYNYISINKNYHGIYATDHPDNLWHFVTRIWLLIWVLMLKIIIIIIINDSVSYLCIDLGNSFGPTLLALILSDSWHQAFFRNFDGVSFIGIDSVLWLCINDLV